MAFVPDEYQKAVIDWRRGEAVVAAAAGAGKSTVLVERTIALVERQSAKPEKILTLVYNRDAAESFRDKLSDRVGPRMADRIPVYTFHAWGYALLRSWYPKAAMLRQVLGAPGCKLNPAKPVYIAMDEADVSFWTKDWHAWLGMADFIRDRDLDWSTEAEHTALEKVAKQEWGLGKAQVPELVAFLRAYEAIKRDGQYASIDFADMLFLPCRTIRAWEVAGRPGVTTAADPYLKAVAQLQSLYDHVQIDEAQDTAPARWRVALHLAAKARSFVACGDARQSLYSWQGAEPEELQRRLDAGATLLVLPVNRRSTAAIVEYGNAVCRGYDWHLGGDCLPLMERGQGVPPEIVTDADEMDEPRYVVSSIAHGLKNVVGVKPSSFAILSRTNRGLIPFELSLIVRGIPCRVLGRPGGVWGSILGREVLSYLRLSEGVTKGVDVLDVMNKPLRFCRKHDAIVWMTAVRESAKNDAMPGVTVLDTPVSDTQAGTGISRLVGDLRRLSALPWTDRTVLVQAWLLGAMEAEEREAEAAKKRVANEPAKPFQDVEDDETEVSVIYKMLCQIARDAGSLDALEKAIKLAQRETKDAVTLSTVHRAKGQEWEVVYVTGARHKMMPHEKSTDREEERRIFYVACTRAKRDLIVTTGGYPSVFLGYDEPLGDVERA